MLLLLLESSCYYLMMGSMLQNQQNKIIYISNLFSIEHVGNFYYLLIYSVYFLIAVEVNTRSNISQEVLRLE